VIEEKIALLLPEVLEDASFRTSDSLTQLGVRSALCVPLWVIEENEQPAPRILGLVYLDSRAPGAPFSEMDLQILTVIANVAAAKIETARLLDESREKRQLEHDMRIAAEIQASLQPVKPPQDVPGYRVAGMSRSCRAVGGDYFDFMFDGQRLHMALGDVSGKGYGAAMLMTALRAATRSHWVDGTPVDAMARINRAFHQCVPSDKYATLFLGRLHARSGRLVYVNAGHNPPLLVRAEGRLEVLATGGTIVGSFEGSVYEEAVVEIHPGDTLLVYSDGISDAWPTLEAAERALAEYVRHGRSHDPARIGDLIFQATERTAGGGREDDRTLVIVRREPY
jgi:serine phosphatase RsbU (regulator of sigma subunit)